MRKILALAGSFVFLVIAPGSVAGYGPWMITHWRLGPPFFGVEAVRYLGMALVALGLIPLIESFARFALKGLGTPAPLLPPRRLVVGGFYRYVRNPMYVGVVAMIAGQGLWLGSVRLIVYAAIVWTLMHLFVVTFEEPKLGRTFGKEYATFRKHVPRWIPRLRPWKPDG